jgi:hypothetical protein
VDAARCAGGRSAGPPREVFEDQGAVGPDPTEETGEDEGQHGGHHPVRRPEVQRSRGGRNKWKAQHVGVDLHKRMSQIAVLTRPGVRRHRGHRTCGHGSSRHTWRHAVTRQDLLRRDGCQHGAARGAIWPRRPKWQPALTIRILGPERRSLVRRTLPTQVLQTAAGFPRSSPILSPSMGSAPPSAASVPPATEYVSRWRGRVISAEQPDIISWSSTGTTTEGSTARQPFLSSPRDAIARHDPDPGVLLVFSRTVPSTTRTAGRATARHPA